MSMQICVLSDTKLISIAEWQKAIDEEGFSLRLCNEEPIAQISGYLQAKLKNNLTGFECDHLDPSDIVDTYPAINFGHDWKQAMSFTWIGDLNELQAAWIAATAYARATGGVVFDEETGQLLNPAQALERVQNIQRDLPNMEALIRDRKGD